MKKLLNILPVIAAVLLIASVCGWASPCNGMLETVNGNEVHMACFYLRVPSLVIAFMWIAISIEKLQSKKLSALLLTVSGILAICVTIYSISGIEICANVKMSCHTTVRWIRGLGALVVLTGLLSLYDPEKQVR